MVVSRMVSYLLSFFISIIFVLLFHFIGVSYKSSMHIIVLMACLIFVSGRFFKSNSMSEFFNFMMIICFRVAIIFGLLGLIFLR